MSLSDLAGLQRAMRTALHDGDAAALLARVTPSDHAGQRIAVYAGMYFTRQAAALAEDFPVVRRLAGAEFFERLAVTHVKRRPSSHPSLAFLGRGFAETLVELGLPQEAAVARLEWARVEAFWAEDAELLTPEDLGALGDGLAAAVLAPHPSLRLVELAGGVLEVAAGAGPEALDLARTEPVAVFRKGEVIHDVRLIGPEAEALRRALAGATVAEVCEAFAAEPEPVQAALRSLVEWCHDGWLRARAGD